MYINANKIYVDAVRWAKDVSSDVDDTTPGQSEALVSLMFASLSIETFMNELVYHADVKSTGKAHPLPSLQTFADVLTEMEQSKAPITSKILMGKFILSGESFDKGKNPYQDFALLVRLRNEITHQKAYEEFRVEDGKPAYKKRNILESFSGMNVLGKAYYQNQEVVTNWLDEISTRAMAVWACGATAGIVNAMLDAANKVGNFGIVMDHIYRERFNIPLRP
jgi:hypothetical protein